MMTKQEAIKLASDLNGKRPSGSMLAYDAEATGYDEKHENTVWKVAKYEYKEGPVAEFLGFVGEKVDGEVIQ